MIRRHISGIGTTGSSRRQNAHAVSKAKTLADPDSADMFDGATASGRVSESAQQLERKISKLEIRLALLCRDLWDSHRRDAGLVAVQGRLLREIRRLDPENEALKSEVVDTVRAAAVAHFEHFMGSPEGYIETIIRTINQDQD
jgi:hypothetical protein